MTQRHTYSIGQIKEMLTDRVQEVAQCYAPPARGSYTDKGVYFTLNPGRADKSVGSFHITFTGAYAGRFHDHATGQDGDMLDLIRLAQGCDLPAALREARAFLGLETESPDVRRQRQKALEAGRARRAEAERQQRADRANRRRAAHAMWLSGQERIAGTPVEMYLRDRRGIDLSALGRQPRVLRYHPQCYWREDDPETGEVCEGHGPAMLALVTDAAGQARACHRTYLAIDGRDGRWNKAPLKTSKKVLGDFRGAAINLWRGIGPRGGKPAPLSRAPAGSHVFIAEGIEDALSCVVMLPEKRVLAAVSLGNLGQVRLPDTITTVTLIADNDEGDQARAVLQRAIEAHAAAGREVRVHRPGAGHKDLNDELRAARADAREAG